MKPLIDYFYRFPHEPLQVPGRCRVRIYKRNNGAHTVLLTELDTNPGESITSACARIATNLTSVRGLNPETTRWIQHTVQDNVSDDRRAEEYDALSQVFEEVQFNWDGNYTAYDPQWQRLGDEQAEALTGNRLSALNRRLGDMVMPTEEA